MTKKFAVQPKSAGKPVAFDAALAQEICKLISEGHPLREICRLERMPAWWNVYEWIKKDADFAQRIACARELGYDAIAAESMEIVDAEPERGPDGRIDSASVAHARLRAEHRLKLLAKWSPKKYGDRVENVHTGADGGPVDLNLKVSFVGAKRG